MIPDLGLESIVWHPKVNLQSSHFCNGVYVLLKYDSMHPLFGIVVDVHVVQDTLVIQYHGENFSSHYNAFFIKTRGVVTAFRVHSLADHCLLYARSSFCRSDHN